MSDIITMPNGNTIQIEQDDYDDNPREWDNVGRFLLFHRRYTLGDKDNPYKTEDFKGWDELEAQIIKDLKPVAMFRVGMIDHSGLHVYEGGGAHGCDPGGWDSGTIGFALVTPEAAKRDFNVKKITPAVKRKCLAALRSELATYDQYLSGDVWCYVVTGPSGDVLDSCGGFYGYDYCVEQAKAAAAHDSPELVELQETAACVS